MPVLDSLRAWAPAIETELDRLLPAESEYPSVLFRSMRYTALGGGKRLRAFLVIKGCEIVAGNVKDAIPAACAVEMLHAYSLIHDDLPCMDDDDVRRGRPSNHKVFGEATALLAGDALLTLAFETLTSSPGTLDAARRLALVAELSHAAGGAGMVGGQTVDIDSEGKEIDLATLAYLHSRKTGALIRAAIRMGAIVGGGSEKDLCALGDFADAFGMAFQITDDILDVTSSTAVLGKPAGSDTQKKKATYVAHFGLDRAIELAAGEVLAACRSLEPFGDRAGELRELAQYLLERKS